MWINRQISDYWLHQQALPVRALVGLRQVGKSSFLCRYKEDNRGYVTLDDPLERDTARLDPELFFEQHSFPVIIDECQQAPELFSSMKKRIDEWRLAHPDSTESPVWLSGSSQLLLDRNIKESLAGRVSYYNMHPLSLVEMMGVETTGVETIGAETKAASNKISVGEALIKGGWPVLWANPGLSSSNYYSDYIRSAVEKDVIAIGRIEKTEQFTRTLMLLAGRAGNLLNQSSISNDAGVVTSTISEWIDLLTTLGFIYKLKPYHTNFSKRVVKSPKLYFCDSGLMARLCGWSQVEPLLVSPQAGAIFENLIFTEILKAKDNYGLLWNIYFWRTRDGEEVDFVIENGRHERVAVEVKLGGGDPLRYTSPPEFRKAFGEQTPIFLVGLNSETKVWRNGVRSVHPLELADELRKVLT